MSKTVEFFKNILHRDYVSPEEEKEWLEKASKTWPLLLEGLYTGQKGVAIPDNYESFSRVYKDMPWVYASIFAIATAGADLPYKLISKGKDGKEKEITDPTHPVIKLLEKPNDTMSRFDLFESTLLYTELNGNAYWEKVPNKLGNRTAELHVIRPDRMKVISDGENKKVKGYVFRIKQGGKEIEFDVDDIVHIKYFDPLNDWYGMGSIKPLVETIKSEEYAINYNQNFFKNYATPRGVLYTDRGMGEESAKRVKLRWDEWALGYSKAHGTVVLPFNLKFQAIGTDPKDMEFRLQREWNREEQLAVLGTNNAILGITKNMTFDNYRMQVKAFYKHTMKPKLHKIESAINAFLLPEFAKEGETLYLRFDLSDILGDDKTEKMNRSRIAVEIGAKTPNQVIEEQEIGEKYVGGDTHFVKSTLIPVGSVSGNVVPGKEPGEPGEGKEIKEPGRYLGEQETLKKRDEIMIEAIENFQEKIEKVLNKLGNKIEEINIAE